MHRADGSEVRVIEAADIELGAGTIDDVRCAQVIRVPFARSIAQHQIGTIFGDGYQPAFATDELASPEGIPQTLGRSGSHPVAVDIPVGADMAEESAPLSLGQCPPAALGMR